MSPYVHGDEFTPDDEWADATKTMTGGVGGMFIENNVPILYLTDPSKKDAAVAQLQASPVAPFGVNLSTAVARQGRWTFSQLAEWYRLISPALPPPTGTMIGDINEAKNRIEFTVSSASARTVIEAKLQTLSVPCYLVAVKLL
ncbi:MAG: hypothetical protein ACO1Q7_20370 [Gemmatimonas sp.]